MFCLYGFAKLLALTPRLEEPITPLTPITPSQVFTCES